MTRLLAILVMIAGAVITLALLSGCAGNLRQSAHGAIAADGATTAYGIASGTAKEANPLLGSPAVIAASLAGRALLVEHFNRQPEPQRTTNLSFMNGVTWGVAASNMTVLALHSNPLGAVVGLASGYYVWRSTAPERAFAVACASERIARPDLICKFKTSN